MNYDVIIIGSGLSGLAAGIRLALFDKKVLIVEKHVEVGGLNSFYIRKHRTFDVGLHAMTNYTPKGVRSSPLAKLLRQLRFKHDDFRLCPQEVSGIRFPEKALRFSNEFGLFEQEVAEQFPSQVDGFQKLLARIREFNELDLNDNQRIPSRRVVESCLSDPMLIDMLYCPLMYYGSASEGDMDFYQFVIMFKSIFMEGVAKPVGGMPYILNLLVEKYRNLGGELRMGAGVEAIEPTRGILRSVHLENGETLTADKVISSAGYVETLRLCRPRLVEESGLEIGRMSFMESLFVMDCLPKEVGYDSSIVFYSTEPRFRYRVPEGLTDVTSGVLCCPNNFQYPEPASEGMIRITNQANFGLWDALARPDYRAAKREYRDRGVNALLTYFPDFRDHVIYVDSFTPKTIFKYTGHLNGAVYGSPKKVKSGLTPVKNLFICGTDQGFLGIIGATLSGISMANLHVLQEDAKSAYGRI
ncbi:MAG: NAD(P)/FAD-dependent oxidoreductase [Nitrospinae bacterium]|nr:NAD(P)/FAD-dependent oxidoreductase [Nitrospinota bacterium]